MNVLRRTVFLVGCCVAFAAAPGGVDAQPAFPGAEGFGSDTPHARGRSVFHVTRLDDEAQAQQVELLQPGQFRYALARAEAAGGGYIVFDVAGTIVLKRPAYVPSNTYIAGQSAPGTGIAIEGGAILIGTADKPSRDVLIRHIRHRGRAPAGADAFNIEGAGTSHVVLDHVSVSFFRDGAVDIVNGATDVTLQWSHFGDASDSGTDEPYHGEPHLLRTNVNRVSMHHNYYTHAHSRVPWVQETAAASGFLGEFSNNVVYDFRKYPTTLDAPGGKANVIGNYYIPGRYTHAGSRPAVTGKNGFNVHVRDNRFVGGVGHDDKGAASSGDDHDVLRGNDANVIGVRPDDSKAETAIMASAGLVSSSSPFPEMPAITYRPAAANVDEVISKFGALPRDNTDRRLAREVYDRTGEWKLTIPADGNVYQGTAPADADADGIADAWESSHGGDLSPHGRDLDAAYDNLEVYLNAIAADLLARADTMADVVGPTLTAVSPATGSTTGGTPVTLTGTGFVPGTTVSVGGVAATGVTVVDSRRIDALTAASSSGGAKAVTITTPAGRAARLIGAFKYVVPLAITSVAPNSGPTAGGTAITVTGTAFASGVQLLVGGTAALNLVRSGSTRLTATTPPGPGGPAAVTVTNAQGVSATLVAGFTYQEPSAADADGDGLPSEWESRFGLDPASAEGQNGAGGDPDSDGIANADEYREGGHPRGFFKQYFADGANDATTKTLFALVNPAAAAASVALRFVKADGSSGAAWASLPGRARSTVDASAVPEVSNAGFWTLVESDASVVAMRTMQWTSGAGSGAHVVMATPKPLTTWYAAEGTTTGESKLFYVLQNPNAQAASVRVTYILPSGASLTRDHSITARSRTTIFVNQEAPQLSATDVWAVISSLNGVGVVAERSQYVGTSGAYRAGHASPLVAAPQKTWMFAEGATGSYFDAYFSS